MQGVVSCASQDRAAAEAALGVLVVDDDLDILEGLAEWLTEEGYDVATATDGQAALDKLRGGLRPCVILLDLMMPRMSGWEFRSEQMKDADLKDIPVVVLTAVPTSEASLKAQLGDIDIVRKPLRHDVLLGAVQCHCGEPSG